MNNHECQKLYRLATLEIDEKKIPERIFDARGAVQKRLQALDLGSNHHAEKRRLDGMLRTLSVLEAESQKR
jgi:hypothetical protein